MIEPVPTVSVAIDSAIATISFGGTKGNSLPAGLLAELAREVTATASRDDVRVIVLRSTGEGPFCAGASFDELTAIADTSAGKQFFLGFARVVLAMIRAPKPIIVRVHGKVVGGGVGIVAASDYAIATDSAAVRLSELAVGIGPFVVGPAIERKIGAGPLSAMSLDADWRDAAWAERNGLYAKVVDGIGALDELVLTTARKVAAANPEAVTKIKAITWTGTDEWEALLDRRASMSGTLVLSDFTRRAIASFTQRG